MAAFYLYQKDYRNHRSNIHIVRLIFSDSLFLCNCVCVVPYMHFVYDTYVLC